MGTRQTTFGKLERERAKKAKAAAKRARRQDRSDEELDGDDDIEVTTTPDAARESSADLLKKIEELHARYDDEQINFLTFEKEKTELMARLAELPLDELT